jgi:NAD(P)-dependent dehydrogenase (short-subunit alcohol dehydrogenase family)
MLLANKTAVIYAAGGAIGAAAARRMSDQGSGVIVTLTAVPGRMPVA